METSENINELAAALSKAQIEIDNPAKNSANPFFKSKYADLAEVLNVVRPAFSANGLSISQHPAIADGIVTVTTILMHSSGQWIKSAISATAGKDIQASGSAITYCRRYALSAIAGVAQADDDGNKHVKDTAVPPKKADMTPKKTANYYEVEADKCATVEDLGAWYTSKRSEIEAMAPAEVKKINSYVSQLKAALCEPSQ